jgi:hypothetical protein
MAGGDVPNGTPAFSSLSQDGDETSLAVPWSWRFALDGVVQVGPEKLFATFRLVRRVIFCLF